MPDAPSRLETAEVSDSSASPLTIRLFGPFEASVNGAPLPRLRSLKGQLLLALVALHANQRGPSGCERAWLTALLSPSPAPFPHCSLLDLIEGISRFRNRARRQPIRYRVQLGLELRLPPMPATQH